MKLFPDSSPSDGDDPWRNLQGSDANACPSAGTCAEFGGARAGAELRSHWGLRRHKHQRISNLCFYVFLSFFGGGQNIRIALI